MKRPGCGLRPGAASWGMLWCRPGTQQPQRGNVGCRMRTRPVRGSECSSGNDRGCHKGCQVHFQSAQGGGSSGAPRACMGGLVGVGGKLGPHAQLRGHRPAASWMVPLRPTAVPGRHCVWPLEHCAVSAPQRSLCLRLQEATLSCQSHVSTVLPVTAPIPVRRTGAGHDHVLQALYPPWQMCTDQ